MLKLFVFASIMALCQAQKETNVWWKPNDLIVSSFDTLYDNLAHTVEDGSNKQKKSFSIMIAGILQYMASDGENNAPIDLDRPGDIIAADIRSQFDVFKSVLDPAINVVKRACPPEASEKKCAKALAEEEKKETEKCPEFPEYMKFQKINAELFDNDEYKHFLLALVKESENENFECALEFVKELEEGKKFKGQIQKLLAWYKTYANGNFRCNLPPLKKKPSSQCECCEPSPIQPTITGSRKKERGHHRGKY